MQKALVLDSNDVRKILAEHFKVDEKHILKSQYTYTVIQDGEVSPEESIPEKC